MTFIEAIILIDKYSDRFELCENMDELLGIRSCICVYKDGEFIGKLRWAKNGEPASVDESVIKALNEGE